MSKVATWLINTWVASSPCCWRLAANTGTKAWLNAPSANRRRNKLGIRNATLKASVMALAPKVEAISSSRIKPVMRETRVKPETMEADLNNDTLWSVARPRLAFWAGFGPSFWICYNRGLC